MRLIGGVTTRWLFGDHLGPHFLDSADQPVLMIEARGVFARRRFHRSKAHLVLSAMRHRAQPLSGLNRLTDLDLLLVQEAARGSAAP